MSFNKNTHIFTFILLVCFILTIQTVSAYSPDEIMSSGEVHILDQGTLYVLHPEEVFQRDNFTIDLLFIQSTNEVVRGNISLEKDYVYRGVSKTKKFVPQFIVGDFDDGTTYLQMSLNDSIVSNTAYRLKFIIQGEQVYSSDFTIKSKEKEILNKSTSQKIIHENISLKDSVEEKNSLRKLLSDKGLSLSQEEFDKANSEAVKNLKIDKTIETKVTTFTDGTKHTESTIYLRLNTKNLAKDLFVIEKIPKELAPTVDEIYFSEKPDVLESDPLVMWSLEDINSTKELSYTVDGTSNIIGETVVLGSFASSDSSKINYKFFIPVLLFFAVAGVLIYFSRFSKKE